MEMDHRKSVKRGHPENAPKSDPCANGSKPLLNVESTFPIPDLIPIITQCSNEDSLIVYDLERESQYGVVKGNGIFYVSESSEDQNRVIVADWRNRSVRIYENKKPINVRVTQTVIDLDASGRRWEGEVKDGNPFGCGGLYNEEGQIEYEGFMMDGVKSCYGIEYYSDIGRVKYDGCYYNNNRFGKGVLYGRDGSINYDGLWKNNEPTSSQFDGKTVDNHTESVVIPNYSFTKSSSFIPSCAQSLKHILIGNDCFTGVRSFELIGLSELESIAIGEQSCILDETNVFTAYDELIRGVCRIVNCPKLQSIHMDDCSFSYYSSFELANLPSLQSIQVGEFCFYNTNEMNSSVLANITNPKHHSPNHST